MSENTEGRVLPVKLDIGIYAKDQYGDYHSLNSDNEIRSFCDVIGDLGYLSSIDDVCLGLLEDTLRLVAASYTVGEGHNSFEYRLSLADFHIALGMVMAQQRLYEDTEDDVVCLPNIIQLLDYEHSPETPNGPAEWDSFHYTTTSYIYTEDTLKMIAGEELAKMWADLPRHSKIIIYSDLCDEAECGSTSKDEYFRIMRHGISNERVRLKNENTTD